MTANTRSVSINRFNAISELSHSDTFMETEQKKKCCEFRKKKKQTNLGFSLALGSFHDGKLGPRKKIKTLATMRINS